MITPDTLFIAFVFLVAASVIGYIDWDLKRDLKKGKRK